jgi:hypothetical protein
MSEIEEKAKAQGWNPDYKGEKAKTAEQFLEDGKKIAPMQAERNEKLANEVMGLKADIKELLENQHKVTAEARKQGYEKGLKKIKDKKIEAAAEADVEKVKALDKEEDKLRASYASETTTVTPNKPKMDPEFTDDWHPKNKWYKPGTKDPATIYAEAIGKSLMDEGSRLSGKAFYNAVKKEVKLVFPDIEGKQPINKLDVSDHSSTPSSPGKKSYSDLPPEAKKACDMQVKKYGIKKDDYVKNYFEMEE